MVHSRRAAHESTYAGFEGHPAGRDLYGEVRCDALEHLQRQALERRRPQLVVRVDRSGLNDHNPVGALYAAIDRVLRPLIAAEERRAGVHLIRPGHRLARRRRRSGRPPEVARRTKAGELVLCPADALVA